jgi:Ca2+-binding EF-hand superfamily protein
MFESLDANGDGKLSKEELRRGYRAVFKNNISDIEINDIYSQIDTDNSGFITI